MNTPYDQKYDKKQKLLIDSFTNELKVFQETCDQKIKQSEE